MVAPAAGKGTRPRPLTAEKLTALVAITDDPILVYCFDELPDLDADEVPVHDYSNEFHDAAETRLNPDDAVTGLVQAD